MNICHKTLAECGTACTCCGMKPITVVCVSCGRELWQGLTREEKTERINDGQAESIECSDCMLKGVFP